MHLGGGHHPRHEHEAQGCGTDQQGLIKHRRHRVGEAGRSHRLKGPDRHDRGRTELQSRERAPQLKASRQPGRIMVPGDLHMHKAHRRQVGNDGDQGGGVGGSQHRQQR